MNKYLFTANALIISFTLFGQTDSSLNSLLRKATENSGLFISSYPVKKINLSFSDTLLCKESLKYDYGYNIDEGVLINLINNCKNPDTSKWSKRNFQNFILVEQPEIFINTKSEIKKLKTINKAQIKKLKRQIADFNNTIAINRNIYYFSRPVFDDSKTYAVISYGNGNKGFLGKDYISLFYFNGQFWQNIGVLKRWIY